MLIFPCLPDLATLQIWQIKIIQMHISASLQPQRHFQPIFSEFFNIFFRQKVPIFCLFFEQSMPNQLFRVIFSTVKSIFILLRENQPIYPIIFFNHIFPFKMPIPHFLQHNLMYSLLQPTIPSISLQIHSFQRLLLPLHDSACVFTRQIDQTRSLPPFPT